MRQKSENKFTDFNNHEIIDFRSAVNRNFLCWQITIVQLLNR